MKLRVLMKGLEGVIKGSKEVEITGISSDSRTVAPGNLFLAKKGGTYDGTQFIHQAVSAGAVAVGTDIYDPFLERPQIIHPQIEALEARLAAKYYGHPSEDLYVVGVTGTKGKTTTSYLIKHLLDHSGKPSGLIGTVETIVGQHRFFSTLTTHDVISNQKWLCDMVKQGCQGAVLEVSSHGLDQGRVDEISFDMAIFTNLYPDHLDYHQTMEKYAAAKKKLFQKAAQAILNADSPWAASMGQGTTFGLEKGEIRASQIVLGPQGTEFRVEGTLFRSPLIGRFNVYNMLAAIALGKDLGVSFAELAEIFSEFPAVPGRMERMGNVFVDFAHTKEALESVLQTLREIARGRVIVVFGAGGNRDPHRRQGMAQAAEKWADLSIITSDNPRTEDPEAIAQQIASGFKQPPLIELDRKRAIHQAIDLARPEDLVLIAGKGHERVQIFAHQTLAFDDVAIVKEKLFQ